MKQKHKDESERKERRVSSKQKAREQESRGELNHVNILRVAWKETVFCSTVQCLSLLLSQRGSCFFPDAISASWGTSDSEQVTLSSQGSLNQTLNIKEHCLKKIYFAIKVDKFGVIYSVTLYINMVFIFRYTANFL